MKRNQQGFSLIELIICVVVIGIISAIAVPNLLVARRTANEGSAVSSIRALHGAQLSYAATNGFGSYAGTSGTPGTSSLTALGSAGLIDSTLGGGTKSGYQFQGRNDNATATSAPTFYFSAIPVLHTETNPLSGTGSRRYGIETSGILVRDNGAAHFSNYNEILSTPPLAN